MRRACSHSSAWSGPPHRASHPQSRHRVPELPLCAPVLDTVLSGLRQPETTGMTSVSVTLPALGAGNTNAHHGVGPPEIGSCKRISRK